MTSAQPTFEQTDWNVYAECYDALLELIPYQKLLKEMITHVDPNAADTILDAGCGTGNLLRALASSCREAALCGVDLSSGMLAYAERKCEGKGTITFTHANLDEVLPFADGTFSKVVSANVLYAVPNPLRTLLEFERVVRGGGTLVLVTPVHGYDNGMILREHSGNVLPESFWANAHASPQREELLLREAFGDEGTVQKMLHVARHNRRIAHNTAFHFFTDAQLLELVTRVGFTPVLSTRTYAGQALLIVATKGAAS